MNKHHYVYLGTATPLAWSFGKRNFPAKISQKTSAMMHAAAGKAAGPKRTSANEAAMPVFLYVLNNVAETALFGVTPFLSRSRLHIMPTPKVLATRKPQRFLRFHLLKRACLCFRLQQLQLNKEADVDERVAYVC